MIETHTIPRYRMSFPADDPESFAGYRAMIAPVLDVTIPRHAAAQPFESLVDTFVLEDMFVTEAHGTALDFDRDHATIARSGIDEIIINLYERGARSLVIDGVERPLAPGEIVVLDLARTFRVSSDAFVNLSLTISRRRFEEYLKMPEDLHGLGLAGGAVHALLREHLRGLCRSSAAIEQAESAAVSAVTLALVAACLRQSLGGAPDAREGAVTLSRVKSAIERQLADPDLGPSSLMREFGLSRPSLYRLFEPAGGVVGYIQSRRLRRAFQLLTAPSAERARISKIAEDLHFGSPTAFGRMFREKFGLSPSEAQALAWRPIDAQDSPWRIPKSVERFITPFDDTQRDLVRGYIEEA